MSRDVDRHVGGLTIGGPARANLLPPEVGLAAQGKRIRRNVVAAVILAVLVAIGGYAGATFLATVAQTELDTANARTADLLSQQNKFAEVKQVTSMLAASSAAQKVGMSTEVDWKAYLIDIQNSLPAGTAVTNVIAETATPLMAFNQPAVPLQGDRIGELKFTATSQSLPDVEKWLEALSTLPGYVDASPGSVSLEPATGLYVVTITLHIDKDALLYRFDEEARDERDQSLKTKSASVPESEVGSKDEAPVAPTEPAPEPSSVDGAE